MELSPPGPVINCCFCDKDLSPGQNRTDIKASTTKYRCPGCERIYCSADCCNGHKEKFSCAGIRNSTPYVHLSKFDQKQFLDDYFFLEKVGNKIDNAQRALTHLGAVKKNQSGTTKNQPTNNKRKFNKRRNKKNSNKQTTTTVVAAAEAAATTTTTTITKTIAEVDEANITNRK
jgi:hypothetical protein